MTTNSILDQAEQRLGSDASSRRTVQHQQIAWMREEIGHQYLMEAKAELPKLEQFIEQEMRPWMARITRLLAKSDNPLPPEQQRYLQEIQTTCDTVPRIIRQGLAGWDQLRPPMAQDGRSMDHNMRRELVAGVRFCLTNWNGRQSRLENLRANIEQFLAESNWPLGRTV